MPDVDAEAISHALGAAGAKAAASTLVALLFCAPGTPPTVLAEVTGKLITLTSDMRNRSRRIPRRS